MATKLINVDHDFSNSGRIHGLQDPVDPQDAATRAFVLANAGGGGGGNALEAFFRQQADYTLVSQTTAQKLFNAGSSGAVDLPTGLYEFEAMFVLASMSATSGNARFLLKGAGSAVLEHVLMQSVGFDSSTPVNTASGTAGTAMADSEAFTGNMVNAATGTGMQARVRGVFDIATAGTLIPSIILTTAAAAVVKANSYIMFKRRADTGIDQFGTWL